MREAEGYLDLLTAVGDHWPLEVALRDRTAQRALDALDRIASKNYRRADVALLRGQALRLMDRFQEALEPLRIAAELEPGNLHVSLALGWCYKRVGRLDLAIQALETSLEKNADEAVLHYNLACYWSLAANVRKALAYLDHSFDLEPHFRDLVMDEPDFDPIRHYPEFLALTSVIV